MAALVGLVGFWAAFLVTPPVETRGLLLLRRVLVLLRALLRVLARLALVISSRLWSSLDDMMKMGGRFIDRRIEVGVCVWVRGG